MNLPAYQQELGRTPLLSLLGFTVAMKDFPGQLGFSHLK